MDDEKINMPINAFADGLKKFGDYDGDNLATKSLFEREAVKISGNKYLNLIARRSPNLFQIFLLILKMRKELLMMQLCLISQ